MADKTELLYLPKSDSSALIGSEAHTSLIARGRQEAAALAARKSEVVYRAVATMRKGEPLTTVGKLLGRPPQFFGLIDTTGKYVVEPVYKAITSFSSGLAAFSSSPVEVWSHAKPIDILFNSDLSLWGFLDHNGKVIIAPRFERARGFCEKLCAVSLNGKWGFIQADGTFAIEPQYDGALDFEDGLARVRIGQKCGFVDRFGKLIIEPRFDCLFRYSEGLACAVIDGRLGYIDRSGTFAIGPRFDSFENGLYGANDFQEGVARVVISGRQCLINKAGDFIFKCSEDDESIADLGSGIARVHESGEYWDHGYFIDTSGNPILSEDSDDPDDRFTGALDASDDFSEGLGVVAASMVPYHHGEWLALRRYADRKGSSRLYGYVDIHGQVKIEPKFYSAKPFKEGLAVVDPSGEGKYGFINKSGELAIEAQFTQANNFANGMATVTRELGRLWGCVDRTGKVVVPCQFDWVNDFQMIAI